MKFLYFPSRSPATRRHGKKNLLHSSQRMSWKYCQVANLLLQAVARNLTGLIRLVQPGLFLGWKLLILFTNQAVKCNLGIKSTNKLTSHRLFSGLHIYQEGRNIVIIFQLQCPTKAYQIGNCRVTDNCILWVYIYSLLTHDRNAFDSSRGSIGEGPLQYTGTNFPLW